MASRKVSNNLNQTVKKTVKKDAKQSSTKSINKNIDAKAKKTNGTKSKNVKLSNDVKVKNKKQSNLKKSQSTKKKSKVSIISENSTLLLDEIEERNKLKESNSREKKVVRKYKFNKKKCIRFILIVILSGVFVFSTTKLIHNQLDMYRNRRDSKKLIDEVILPNENVDNLGEASEDDSFEEERPEVNPANVRIDFDKLRSTNGDIRAWMMFNKMYINNPVVQSGDNEYYLTHNFYGKNSEIGTIFMDYRNKSFDDRNVVLFGHSTIDKSMFGSLSDVFKSGFFDRENADIIYFYDTNNNLLKYQIFSYYAIESEEYYIQTRFSSDTKFQEWINTIKSRSISDRGIEVTASDKVLTLSTCAGSSGTSKRRVIHAKRIQ